MTPTRLNAEITSTLRVLKTLRAEATLMHDLEVTDAHRVARDRLVGVEQELVSELYALRYSLRNPKKVESVSKAE